MKDISVGSYVLTKWDDVGYVRGTVKKIYRGHRCKMYRVKMDDGVTESVHEDQIVGLANNGLLYTSKTRRLKSKKMLSGFSRHRCNMGMITTKKGIRQ